MITIVSGTNRLESFSDVITRHVEEEIRQLTNEKVETILLSQLSFGLGPHQYNATNLDPIIGEVEQKYFEPADQFVFVIPEYNGSFPGILKLFIDALSVRGFRESFAGKRSLSIGVSSGRAGNLRGIDQFDQILQYLGIHTFPSKLPISQVHKWVEGHQLVDQPTIQAIQEVLTSFLKR